MTLVELKELLELLRAGQSAAPDAQARIVSWARATVRAGATAPLCNNEADIEDVCSRYVEKLIETDFRVLDGITSAPEAYIRKAGRNFAIDYIGAESVRRRREQASAVKAVIDNNDCSTDELAMARLYTDIIRAFEPEDVEAAAFFLLQISNGLRENSKKRKLRPLARQHGKSDTYRRVTSKKINVVIDAIRKTYGRPNHEP